MAEDCVRRTLLNVHLRDCNCVAGERYVNGSEPTYFGAIEEAAGAFVRLYGKARYFGVHWGEMHVVWVSI